MLENLRSTEDLAEIEPTKTTTENSDWKHADG